MATEYDAFADTYDFQATGQFGDDLEFYVRLAQEAEPPVLELAAGTGRVTIPIAKAGVPIVGLDSSTEMLAVAREKAAGRDLPITWVTADMTDFDLDQQFGLALCPFRAFLHLLTPEEHLACLQTVHRHLKPGGLFAVNFFVPSIQILAAHLQQLGRAIMKNSRFTDERAGQEVIIWESREYVPHQQLIHQEFIYHWLNEKNEVTRVQHRHFTLCWIWPNEFRHLLARAGFEVVNLFGWFDRRPFDASSTEQVWVARKPA